MRERVWSRVGRCRKNAARVSARAPTGRFTQNAQRQPGPSVKNPPRSGPATEESANTPPSTPMYLPRCRAGMMSAMMAWARMIRPPPPSPWTARPMMRTVMVSARPPRTEPAMNRPIAAMKMFLRPIRSPTLP